MYINSNSITSALVESLTPHPFSIELYGQPEQTEDFASLVEAIRLYGVLEPIAITQDGVVLNGNRRVAAARVVSLPEVPARVLNNLSPQQEKEIILTLNHHRKPRVSTMVREAMALEQLTHTEYSEKPDVSNKHNENGHLSREERLALARKEQELALRVGLRDRRVLIQAKQILNSANADLIDLMDRRTVSSAFRRLHGRSTNRTVYSPVIKPSDNWNFSPVRYESTTPQHGYIPGDIYANCFWYFVRPGNIVIDAMAGSGMAQTVYDRRQEWMGDHVYDFDIKMYDLTPQKINIVQHNLLDGFPVAHADYIFLDIPYFGMTRYAYSRKAEDLANMGEIEYLQALQQIARTCASAQLSGGRCTVIAPNFTDHERQRMVLVTEEVRSHWRAAGYTLTMETFASRRIQQRQDPTMAKMNNIAKERRLPLTDIVVVMTFTKQ
jgi:ParB-like nuclease domain